jgi:periplasmic divalent cation tolerance protein
MSAVDDLCAVTITAPDAERLASFVRELVNRRLSAAGHIVAPMRSIYRWQGEVHDQGEAVATLHTRRENVAAIADLADELHPYEVPCVVAVPFVAGGRAYLDWIQAQSSEPSEQE